MAREIITTRAWAGIMLRPRADFRPFGWGAAFDVGDEVPDAFGLVIDPSEEGVRARLVVWRLQGDTAASANIFIAPTDDQLTGRVEHSMALLTKGMSPDLQAMVWFPLPDGAIDGPGHYAAQVTILDVAGAVVPYSVGVLRCAGQWDWSFGFMSMGGDAMRPAKLPWALAWGLAGGDRRSTAPILPRVQVRARVMDGFELTISDLVVRDLVGPRRYPNRILSIPKPQQIETRIDLKQRTHKMAIPYRWFSHQEGGRARPDGVDSRQIDIVASHARYDLVSVDRFTGELILTLGAERLLDPEEFPASLPRGHLPLYSLFTTSEGIEAVPLSGWRDLVREGEEARHLLWQEWCRLRLPKTVRKLRTGELINLVGYGDSTTALGGRSEDHIARPNGPLRDMMGYLECYGSDYMSNVPLHVGQLGGEAIHHQFGWNWHLKNAIEARSACSVRYDNWGIAGTSSGADFKEIDGVCYPNAANPERLARMLQGRPDLVTVAVGLNDIGERIDTYTNIISICEAVRQAGAEPIVIGPCRPNPAFNSRDDALWRLTHERVIAAAIDMDVAYLATWELYGDGNEGATGLVRSSHCAASVGNHPGPRELSAIGQFLSKIIP